MSFPSIQHAIRAISTRGAAPIPGRNRAAREIGRRRVRRRMDLELRPRRTEPPRAPSAPRDMDRPPAIDSSRTRSFCAGEPVPGKARVRGPVSDHPFHDCLQCPFLHFRALPCQAVTPNPPPFTAHQPQPGTQECSAIPVMHPIGAGTRTIANTLRCPCATCAFSWPCSTREKGRKSS